MPVESDGHPTPDVTGTTPDPDDADPGAGDPESVARQVVLRKLSAQARTRTELDRALQAKKIPEAAANAVLDRLTEVGLVDDTRFALDWVASRQLRRHLSRTVLRQELKAKGVDRDTIEGALSSVDTEAEVVAARALAERKLRGMAGLGRDVRYRRLAGALARRGFSGSITSSVLSELLHER